MDSNKDTQDLFEFNMRQSLQASRDEFNLNMRQSLQASMEDCLKLTQEMNPQSTAYSRGYQNGYLDGFNAGVEHVANGIKKWADSEEDKDGEKG